jgi:hypothetical protein
MQEDDSSGGADREQPGGSAKRWGIRLFALSMVSRVIYWLLLSGLPASPNSATGRVFEIESFVGRHMPMKYATHAEQAFATLLVATTVVGLVAALLFLCVWKAQARR